MHRNVVLFNLIVDNYLFVDINQVPVTILHVFSPMVIRTKYVKLACLGHPVCASGRL